VSAHDELTIRMRPRCRVGHYDWEKDFPRELGVELTLWVDCQSPGRSDDLADAFDYEPVCRRLLEFCEGGTFGLVEAVAEGIARIVLDEFGLARVRVAVTKRESLPAVDGVTVRVERSREG
jgi:dihydroneopterin aldolase